MLDLIALSLVPAPLLLDFTFAALFRYRRKGRFKINEDCMEEFSFKSDLCTCRIDFKNQSIAVVSRKSKQSIPFSRLKGITIVRHDTWAIYAEVLTGFGLNDFYRDDRDRIHWHTITLVLCDGLQVPLYTAGEYEPREVFLGWYFKLQAAILYALKLTPDIPVQVGLVLRSIMLAINRSGSKVPYL